MDQAVVALAWAVGTVFLLAAVGKIAAPSGSVDTVVAIAEALLGAVLVIGVYPLVASLVVAVTALAYCAYAFIRRPDDECSCFGRRLPASSRSVQRARNTLLASLSITYFVLVWATGIPDSPSVSVVLPGVGMLFGVVVVFAPWLVKWTFVT